MADQSTNITQIASSQAGKEVTANALFDASSPSMLFGRNSLTTTGLTWGYYGGRIYIDGVATAIANGTVVLTASQINYVEVGITGVVSSNTAGFSADKSPLYKVTAGASTITNYEDHRNPMTLRRLFYGRAGQAMADANQTLTPAQAACDSIECTGALTLLRDLIVPTVRRQYTVYANTTGGVGVRVKTAAGAGVTVADGTRAILECDGTNVVLVSNSSGGYTLPTASSTVLGGVKVGAGLAIDGAGILSASGSAPATSTLTDFANAPGTTTGLTYGYQAGVIRQDNVTTSVAAGTVALAASTTNYVEITGTGVVSANTVGFTSGRYPLATVLTGAATITTITDKRGVISLGSGAQLGGVNVFTKNQSVSTVALTDGASIAVDASLSNNFKVTLAGNRTLANPTNMTEGMILNFAITQDAIGGRTLSYGTLFKFPGGVAPALSTAANAKDFMSCYYDGAALLCNLNKGFA